MSSFTGSIVFPYTSICGARDIVAQAGWNAVQLRLRTGIVPVVGITAPPRLLGSLGVPPPLQYWTRISQRAGATQL